MVCGRPFPDGSRCNRPKDVSHGHDVDPPGTPLAWRLMSHLEEAFVALKRGYGLTSSHERRLAAVVAEGFAACAENRLGEISEHQRHHDAEAARDAALREEGRVQERDDVVAYLRRRVERWRREATANSERFGQLVDGLAFESDEIEAGKPRSSMTKEEQQVILSAKRWWARKRPLGWTLKQHLAQRTVNCIGAAEQRIGHTVAKLILGAQEPPQPDASQGSARFTEFAAKLGPLATSAMASGEPAPDPAAPQGSPLPGGAVPRGHCNRCERCGWDVSDERGRCRPKDCSMRPMPPPRTHCAGCGAIFDDVVTSGSPPEGGALEGELAEALRAGIAGLYCGHRKHDPTCTLCIAIAVLARFDASKAIPQSGTVKEGT